MEQPSVGQLLLVGVPGFELDRETAARFRRLQPGGFILFTRNIKSAAQLRKLTDDLRDLSRIEPVITVDQEGGRVSRLKEIGNEPPSAYQLRMRNDSSLIRRHGELTGELLRFFGFNLDLCPVLDISFDDEADNSLRGRCYGSTAEQVIEFAGVFNDGLRAGGVLSCGKHFPGYSGASIDPHHDLPLIDRSRAEMEEHELAVFRAFVDRVDSMMVGHALYPALEAADRPASLSEKIVTRLLREELGFQGLVMTDDLDMGAIVNRCELPEAVGKAIRAGNDLAMICHRVDRLDLAVRGLSELPAEVLDSALERVTAFKEKFTPPSDFSADAFGRLDAEVWQLRVTALGEEEARKRSPEDGKRSPVELY